MPFPSLKLEDLKLPALPSMETIKSIKLPPMPALPAAVKDFKLPQLPNIRYITLDDLKNLKLQVPSSLAELKTALTKEENKQAVAVALGVAASGTFIYLIRRSERNAPGVEIISLDEFKHLQNGGLLRDVGTCIITPRVTAVRVTDHGDRIKALPSGLFNLVRLTELNVGGNAITTIPAGISRLTALKSLDVSNNKLETLPEEIGALKMLVVLNAMGNQLQSLPESLGELSSLERLGLKNNKLTSLPASIGKLRKLKELFLTDNQIESIPEEIAGCVALVKLQASFNALKSLPSGLGKLAHLELLRVACCEVTEIPQGATTAPALAWLSLAGNPACKTPSPPSARITTITISDLEVGRKLGDGASGEVFEAVWKNKRVAVKLFRADRSPDGHSADEIAISCALSAERHLVKILAKLNTPTLGVVMEFVEGAPMAEKPNHESLLRCRWAPGIGFSLDFVLNVATGIATALEIMHGKGLIHGDVYAHNVMADNDGNAVLCDYGAAFYAPKNGAAAYEGQEIRAYGLFLRDLLTRMEIRFENMEAALDVQKELLLLVQQCTGGAPTSRPKLGAVARKLKSLQKSAASSRGATPRSDNTRVSSARSNGITPRRLDLN